MIRQPRRWAFFLLGVLALGYSLPSGTAGRLARAAWSAPLGGQTFTVTNTNDSGAGSLRQALTDANNAAGTDTIAFNIPGSGVQTITLASALPQINGTVIVDGWTQPNFAGAPLIEISGTNIPNQFGFNVNAANCRIRGLIINRFSNSGGSAIVLQPNSGGSVVEGNYLGTNATGTAAAGNVVGVNISNAPNVVVGGVAASSRNIISGNAVGVRIVGSAASAKIEGNYIGTNVSGNAAVPNNLGVGLEGAASNNTIGGMATGAGNLISGNNGPGISFITSGSNFDVTGNLVQGNLIGTNAAGTAALPNTGAGVNLTPSGGGGAITNNTIGGTAAGARNVISGNGDVGVKIAGATATQVQGNYIGLNAAGTASVRNNNVGVLLDNATGNTIGGTAAGAGNVISGNNFENITFIGALATNNTVAGNYIGLNAAGTAGVGGSGVGLHNGANNNTIGGTTAAARNVISGNTGGHGVALGGLDSNVATNNRVQGNYIGTNAAGTAVVGNLFSGVILQGTGATNNTVGGTTPGAGNVLSGNGHQGVAILEGASSNTVQGNFIGTDATGNVALGGTGIFISASNNNLIGGTTPAARNVISGNGGGLGINTGATGNQVQGNYFGLNAAGTANVPNTNNALNLSNVSGNTIGGAAAGAGNIITGNTLGFFISNAAGSGNVNYFLSNAVYGNTANTNVSGESNPNAPRPTLTAATTNNSNSLNVRGTLSGVANTAYNVQFFATAPAFATAAACNNGVGQTFVGQTTVTTGSNGAGSFDQSFAANVPLGNSVTATATSNAAGTSRFTACFASALPTITGRVTDANNNGIAGVNVTLSGALSKVVTSDTNGNYSLDGLTPGGNYAVVPVSPYYTFTPPRIDFVNVQVNQAANFTATLVPPPPVPSLTDDFSGGSINTNIFNFGTLSQPLGAFDPQVTALQSGGQLVITPRANQSGAHFNGYVGVNNYDFSNGQAQVELAQAGTNGAESLFSLGADNANYSRFRVLSPLPGSVVRLEEVINDEQRPVEITMPTLAFEVVLGGQTVLSVMIPYDPVAHHFLRFRHVTRDANQNPINSLAFETSPDASVWTERARGNLGERTVTALTVELGGGSSLGGNPGPVIFDNLGTQLLNCRFTAAGVTVNEGDGQITLLVQRVGPSNQAVSVEYSTLDGTASQRSRYVASSGVLNFAAGETAKTLDVLLVDDALVQGTQTFNVFLGPGNGIGIIGPGRTIVTINDNDNPPITTNPLETPGYFVTRQYYDFLSRTPDAGGLGYWSGQITDCGNNAACISARRWQVSLAFFVELEFQQTGAYVYRLYRAAYGNSQPFPNPSGNADSHPYCVAQGCPFRAEHIPSYQRFVLDRARVVGSQNLPVDQLALATAFVNRAEFRQRYPTTQTAAQFVDAVLATIQASSNVNLTGQRDALLILYNAAGSQNAARGAVLYRLADDNAQSNPINNRAYIDAEYNRGFVLTQYFGYLRRDPDQPGLNFWLATVNRFPVRDLPGQNAMVCAFVTSQEYQERFSLISPRNNGECPPAP